MDSSELGHFLGIDVFLSDETSTRRSLALALSKQVDAHFDYEILDSQKNGYSAAVSCLVTTLDSSAILSSYREQLDVYLSSADSLTGGYDARLEKGRELLLEAIQNNQDTARIEEIFHLSNDGVSWKLDEPVKELGEALLGSLLDPEEAVEGAM